jgi:hypothetical protein
MAAVRQVRQMQEVVDRMNLQIYRVGGLKILGAILTAALSDTTTWYRWCRSDFVTVLGVRHEEVFADVIGRGGLSVTTNTRPSYGRNHPKWS